MESTSSPELFSLHIDPLTKTHLTEAARWARFLAIVGFVMCGLIVLIGLFAGSLFSTMFSRYGGGNDYGVAMASSFSAMAAVMYIIYAVIYFFPFLFLFRFANKMRTALASNEQNSLNESFQNLKATFRYLGILTIIGLAFVVIGLLFMVVGLSAFNR